MNPDNAMRTHLVTMLHCTDCGGQLRLSYDGKRMDTARDPDGITGACKVVNRLYVEPCRKCVGDAQKPLQQIREALAAIGPAA